MPADVAETAVVASAKEGRTSYDSTMAQFEAEAASREVEAEQAAPATNGMDLMSMLNSITSQVETMSKEASERTEVLNTSVTRQRRKSRELEQSVFGMHLTDVHKLHEVFDEIDTDKSGSIDVEELEIALHKIDKKVTRAQAKRLLKRFDTDGNGTLEFDEYRLMVGDWDRVIAVLENEDAEAARVESALAAASATAGVSRRSLLPSQAELPTAIVASLDLASPTTEAQPGLVSPRRRNRRASI